MAGEEAAVFLFSVLVVLHCSVTSQVHWCASFCFSKGFFFFVRQFYFTSSKRARHVPDHLSVMSDSSQKFKKSMLYFQATSRRICHIQSHVRHVRYFTGVGSRRVCHSQSHVVSNPIFHRSQFKKGVSQSKSRRHVRYFTGVSSRRVCPILNSRPSCPIFHRRSRRVCHIH